MSHDPIKLLQDAHRAFKTAEKESTVPYPDKTSLSLLALAQGLAKMTESFLTIHVAAKMAQQKAEDDARGGYTMGDGPG
jgi:hypothetical protein